MNAPRENSIDGIRDIGEAQKAWRANARQDLRKPLFWILIGSLYLSTFLISLVSLVVLDWMVPRLPWIPKPCVNADNPPLVTAFYCANMVPGSFVLVGALLYFWGVPANGILWRKTNSQQ